MSDTKLSIVVPVYNAEKYIVDTVTSLQVDSTDYEIILVDDCSKDTSAALCDDLAARYGNVSVIHKIKNEGLSMARNTGIDAARGEYLCFVDSDDRYAEKDAVMRIIDATAEDRDIFFVNMDKWYADNTRVTVNEFRNKIHPGMTEREICAVIAREKSAPVSASLKIMRRSIVIEENLLFKPGIFCEDIEWFFRVIASGIMSSCGYIDVTYLYFQGNRGSITKNVSEKNINDLIDILESLPLPERSDEESRAECIRRIAAFETMIGIYNLKSLKGDARKRVKRRLSHIVGMMRYTDDKRVKATYVCSKIFGVGITSRLLGVVRGQA